MRYSFLFLISLFTLFVHAQVPQWTAVSCQGDTFNMHKELASGKAVVMDFGAIWCQPCQKSAPELQALWELYGEDTGRIKVFNFLLQDNQFNNADCADVAVWEDALELNYPGFPFIDSIYTAYNNAYGSNQIPLILLFIPNMSAPENSLVAFNTNTGLGINTGDYTIDLDSVLNSRGFHTLNSKPVLGIQSKVFPNPSSEKLFIESSMAIKSFQLVNKWGSIVLKMEPTENMNSLDIDVSTLTPGLYYAIIEGESENWSELIHITQ